MITLKRLKETLERIGVKSATFEIGPKLTKITVPKNKLNIENGKPKKKTRIRFKM